MFITKNTHFTQDNTMYSSVMDQPMWPCISFDFQVRYMPYFDQNINVTI